MGYISFKLGFFNTGKSSTRTDREPIFQLQRDDLPIESEWVGELCQNSRENCYKLNIT